MYTKLRPTSPLDNERLRQRAVFGGQVLLLVIVIVQFAMLYRHYALFSACGLAEAALMRKAASSNVPDYYQTSPELFPGTMTLV